jgi:hypothetical protein
MSEGSDGGWEETSYSVDRLSQGAHIFGDEGIGLCSGHDSLAQWLGNLLCIG